MGSSPVRIVLTKQELRFGFRQFRQLENHLLSKDDFVWGQIFPVRRVMPDAQILFSPKNAKTGSYRTLASHVDLTASRLMTRNYICLWE